MDTEVVAIVVPGAVAAIAILAATYQHKRSLDHAGRLADLAYVRDLLDEAAVALHDTTYVLDEVRSSITQHGGNFFKSDEGTSLYTQMGTTGERLDALVERLAIRLGRENPVARRFEEADAAFLEIYRSAGRLRLEPDADGHPAARAEVRRLHEQERERLRTEREAFDAARKAFVDAAQETAGSRLTAND